jgi:hypothetical protein
MPVTAANLIQGAATLYHGAFGATEPADAQITSNPAAGWTDVGATVGGVALRLNYTYAELEADQLVDVPGRVLTKREAMVVTQLAEPTLEMIKLATNTEAAIAAVPGPPAVTTLEPDATAAAVQPTYCALIIDGIAEGADKRRRIIIRRALMVAQLEMAYQKDGQTVIPVEFHAHHVSDAIRPWKIVDQT